MSKIKIISQLIDGTTHEFDVDQNVAIALSLQLISLTDIDQRKGDYTQSFPLPRTDNNDNFFGNWGDPSTIGENWNTRVEAPAWILEDDNIIVGGILSLDTTDPNMDKYYITITGNISTIKSILGESEMAGLNMAPWIYTPTQIFSTWNRSLFSGDMVFPIHDFGFGYGLYKKQGSTNVLQDITNSATPIILNQTIPSFRLTKLLQMMFNEQDIEVGGSLFSESSIDDVYIQADNALEAFTAAIGLFNTKIGNFRSLDSTQRILPWVGNPISGDFSDATNTYTAPLAGSYTFQTSITPVAGTPSSLTCLLRWIKNGVTTLATTNFDWNSTVNDTRTFTLAAGDTIRLEWVTAGAYTVAGYINTGGADFFKLTNAVPSGTSVDPSAYWANHRQVDFFRSIVQIFNLVPWFDPNGMLRLDTWDYYKANYGERKDWTEKVDVDSIDVKPINGELRNPVYLALQHPDNVLNNGYFDSVGRPYGSYQEDQNIPGTLPPQKEIEGFSPAAPQSIPGIADMLVCKYYANEDSLAYKSPGLQIMYYNGVRTVATFYTADASGGATTARTGYPYFSNFKLSGTGWNVSADTLDLNFTYWTPPTPGIVLAPSTQGLFNRYFREMIRQRYDEGSKVVTMNVLLDAADIANFSFADDIIVTINGTPVGLQIVNIDDYSPNSKQLSKVKSYIIFID